MSRAPLGRRVLLSTVLGGAALLPALAGVSAVKPARRETPSREGSGIVPDSTADQSVLLQRVVDEAAIRGVPVVLPSGRIRAAGVKLRPGSMLSGAGMRTTLIAAGDGPVLVGEGAHACRLERLVIEAPAGGPAPTPGADHGLIDLDGARDIAISDVTVVGSPGHGIVLRRCSGRIGNARVRRSAAAGIVSLDAAGLAIEGNHVSDCANNGILVWRSTAGQDGTRVSGNRIERISARAGGSGQNGNGINVFRASGVLVTGNRVTDCAYSAVRANAASNVQIVANGCERLGEVAIYAEFGFEGALIAQNIVDGAASGICVTNFDHGGRLAVVQGNLVRNLRRREHESVDKRGEGITIEADAAVSGNTIENAPTAGIVVGWGKWMREVAVTGNVVRKSRIGIMVTRDPAAGTALIAQNLVSGASGGAVRLMDHGAPAGGDLARAQPLAGRISVTGNLVVDGPA